MAKTEGREKWLIRTRQKLAFSLITDSYWQTETNNPMLAT